METENLYSYQFRKEIMDIAASCVGLKPATAKKKVDNIFKKYDSIISYSSNHNSEYYEKKYWESYKKFNILKKGSVEYLRGEIEGTILLKDIEQIEVRQKDVLLITKTGREIIMGEDFKYLKDLF
jgi:hypothetical protein